VTFSYFVLPALSACKFTPAVLTPGISDATTNLTLTTTAPSTALATPLGGPPAFIGVIVGILGMVRGATRRRKPALRVSFAVLTFWTLSLALINCGGGSTGPTGTPSGNYRITVTAASGEVSHSAAFELVVN
jgi:hypothetical protein